jgi:hypothetical protein
VVSAIIAFSKIKPLSGVPQKYFLFTENLSICEMSKIMHKRLGYKYNPINMPETFWKFLSYCRRFTPVFEYFLPPRIYNQIWRAGIIVDNVVATKSDKVSKKIPGWKAKRFQDFVSDVL